MINSNKNVEILAPCGSYDILLAAVNAGADACYIGGDKFGARAYAANFDTESIIKAIDYAHVHDAGIYLTINTLFKNNELDTLYDYLLPLYRAGLDAVIVQDLGVFKYIRENFPDIHIHCSTQMNVTSRYAAEYMKKLGASRIVTAREMSLDEIRKINDSVDIEIETFVHGAMCYSYSGQCLMSSLAGGRSGNRGRCAQPCRKCYDNRYLLSMKDMCAINLIPDIIDAGIDSLKIEGRMKNAYYVASAVDAYKELSNDYINGCYSPDKAEKMKFRLANIYNRGGFSDGYFYMHNGRDIISIERPNNQGIEAGQLVGIDKGSIRIKLAADIYKGDVLELKLKDGTNIEITSGTDGKAGSTVNLNAPKTRMLQNGQKILRTRCNVILKEIESDIISGNKNPCKIKGHFSGKIGEPMVLELTRNVFGRDISIRAVDENGTIEPSENRPADREQIHSKLSQLGNTDYQFETLTIDIDNNAFIPIGNLKRLRRDAIDMLEDKITGEFRRECVDSATRKLDSKGDCDIDSDAYCKCETAYLVGVTDMAQLRIVVNCDRISGVRMSAELFNEAKKNGFLEDMRKRGLRIYISLPYIIHNDFDLNKYLPNERINGIYIRNIDGMAAYVRAVSDGLSFADDCEIICGASLYGYNNLAREFMHDMDSRIIFEMPKELNVRELSEFVHMPSMFTIYEHQQVMLSAQCVHKTKNKCNHNNDRIMITDDKGNSFHAQAVCDECCNVVYNGAPFVAPEQAVRDLTEYGTFRYYNLNFTIESADMVKQIIDILDDCISPEELCGCIRKSGIKCTGGHCYRGVE